MADVDEWGQMTILSALQRYARTQFSNPQKGVVEESFGGNKPGPGQSGRKVTGDDWYALLVSVRAISVDSSRRQCWIGVTVYCNVA